MTEEKDEKRISLRVSPELHEQITVAANSRNLSINAFIIQALELAVDPNGMVNRLAIIEEKLRYLTVGP